jgi:hypothetical protein
MQLDPTMPTATATSKTKMPSMAKPGKYEVNFIHNFLETLLYLGLL